MDVIERLHRLCRREHDCTVDVIEALVECERTRAHIDRGHDGLWSLLVDELEYSHAAATRRLKATRCAVKFPVVLKWMRKGRVNVSALEAVAPLLDVIGTPQQLLRFIQGRTAAEIARSVARERPRPAHRDLVRREFVRVTMGDGPELFGDPSPHVATSIEAASQEATAAPPTQSLPSTRSASSADPLHGTDSLHAADPLTSPSAAVGHGSSAPPHPHEATIPRVAPDNHTPTDARADLDSAPSTVGRPALERVRVSLSFGADEFADLERARAILSRRTGRVPSIRETLMEVTRFYLREKGPKKRDAAPTPGRARERKPDRERAATHELHRGGTQPHDSTSSPDMTATPLTGAATSDRYSSMCVPSNREFAEVAGQADSPTPEESPTSLDPPACFGPPTPDQTLRSESVGSARDPDRESDPNRAPASRHIPRAVRDAVLLRDGESCTFVGPDGRRCNSTFALQIDHIHPFALGGTHDPSNLRVLCGMHNRREAERVFGRRTMVTPR